MKYYLVNYILLDNKVITLNENIGISLYSFANIEEFKQTIAARKSGVAETEQVVIKSYKQISQEAYNCLDTTSI